MYLDFALRVRQTKYLASFLTPQINQNYSDFPAFYQRYKETKPKGEYIAGKKKINGYMCH